MKQLFRCEYCTEVGTEEEIKKHEEECLYNYTKKSCWTCKYKEGGFLAIKCNASIELEPGKYMAECSKYEWDEKDHTSKSTFAKILDRGLF